MNIRFYLPAIFVFACSIVTAKAISVEPAAKDSIIITFGDKTRMVIYGNDKNELDKIMKYDLNALLRDLRLRLDSSAVDTTYIREEIDGKTYLKDKDSGDVIKIGVSGVYVKNGDTEVVIRTDDGKTSETDNGDRNYVRNGKNFVKSRRYGSSPRKGFSFALGLNTYGNNETTPGYNKEGYDLKPFGSRYVSLGYIGSAKIIRGEKAGFHLDFGVDFSWFNLMYDGNTTIYKLNDRDQVGFREPEDDNGQKYQSKKSKLVVPNVNLSIMPTVSFKNTFISYISAGMYGGYRLGSYTKVRKEGSKDVDHDRTNFYLNNFRYGVAAEVGFKNFINLFVNYDLNTLHETNKGPKVNMISFGIKL